MHRVGLELHGVETKLSILGGDILSFYKSSKNCRTALRANGCQGPGEPTKRDYSAQKRSVGSRGAGGGAVCSCPVSSVADLLNKSVMKMTGSAFSKYLQLWHKPDNIQLNSIKLVKIFAIFKRNERDRSSGRHWFSLAPLGTGRKGSC